MCVYIYVCMYVYMYVCMYVYMYVCMYVCRYVCTYVCMYMYMYTISSVMPKYSFIDIIYILVTSVPKSFFFFVLVLNVCVSQWYNDIL